MSLEVWCKPESNHAYVLGVDTAEGLGHGDYSCIQVLDVSTGDQAAIWHGHIPPDELAARGDVTLSFYKTETPNGQPAHRFEGDAWVCGGIGFDCDPGTWGPNWSGRWWGDSWCWQAGAAADVIWQSWDGWDYSLSADYE